MMSVAPSGNGFVKLRRGILEHIEKGLLPANELAAYVYIILRADHNTGVWTGSALRLARAFRVSWPTGKVWLRALRAKGYIDCHPSRAQRGDYPIRVLRYRPAKKQAELFPDDGSRLASEGSPLSSRGQPATPFEGSRLPPSTQEVEPTRREEDTPARLARGVCDELLLFWNWNAEHRSLPKVLELTATRRKKILARIRSDPDFPEKFKAAVRKARDTAFLCGAGERGWRANFDWFIENDTHVVAVLEGQYDDAKGIQPHVPGVRDIVPRQPTPEVRNA